MDISERSALTLGYLIIAAMMVSIMAGLHPHLTLTIGSGILCFLVWYQNRVPGFLFLFIAIVVWGCVLLNPPSLAQSLGPPKTGLAITNLIGFGYAISSFGAIAYLRLCIFDDQRNDE